MGYPSLGVERTPVQVTDAQNPTWEISDPIQCQWGLLFISYSQCRFLFVRQVFGWAGSKNLYPIDRLATNQHIPLNKTKLKMLNSFANLRWLKLTLTRSWFQHMQMHPIPNTDFFCLFYPYLSRGWLWWTPMLALCCKATSSGLMLTLIIRGQIWCV